MKAAESLFEFMPYGAPELLQSRRERLASAILVSSVTVVAAFAVVGGLARLTDAPSVVILPPSCPPLVEPKQYWTARRPPARPPAPPGRAPSAAGVRVVPGEPDVPVVEDGGKSVDGVVMPEAPGPASDGPITSPAEEALPPPGTFVWAEQFPEAITQVTPIYPEIARDAGVEGLVIVKVLVGKTGRVLDARLDPKRQVPILNESALAAARQWVFTPALANGRPVAVWTAIPFNFRLR